MQKKIVLRSLSTRTIKYNQKINNKTSKAESINFDLN